jgi:hypothetical protein
MIFNDQLMFIHIGKTGGSSCAEYLIHNLRGPAYDCHAEADRELAPLGIEGVYPLTQFRRRHATLAEAGEYVREFDGRMLAGFAKIVAVIRHPYTLEYSHYRYMQLPAVRERERHNPGLLERTSGDFRDFVARAGYHRANTRQEDYFLLDGAIPGNVELVRYEELAAAFPRAVDAFLKPDAAFAFPHSNRTGYSTRVHAELTEEVEALIYRKHQYMFDSGLYERTLP